MRSGPPPGSAREVFGAFLRLGLTSFGGPIAHLGYFRHEFVQRRGWLDEHAYAELVALCQFLPGPASSQVGFALGLRRAGWSGALAAWLGFTLPSALLLVLFALGLARAEASPILSSVIHALKIVAVAVVAQAVAGMWKALCPDWPRRALALATATVTLGWPGVAGQLLALGACALAGWRRSVPPAGLALPEPADGQGASRASRIALAMFFVLLAALPLAARASAQPWLQLFEAFYRAGALVFGGGHVVLPLLQAGVVGPGWASESAFLAGYGAAQAVPGPLFTFAAYLGAVIGSSAQAPFGPHGAWLGAAACLVAVFLPGLLLVAGALPAWTRLRRRVALRGALAAVNAGVAGILLAALIDPVATGAVRSVLDALVAAALALLLMRLRWPPMAVVATAIVLGAARALLG